MYVDTSVIVAMLTDEPKTQACKSWFGGLKQAPISSDWLITEFYSAIALKQRTGQLQAKHINPIFQQFEAFINGGVKLMPVSREAFNQAGKLTHTYANTRAGDALHLSVALECDAKDFVTLDNAQLETAKKLKFNATLL